MRSAKIVTCVVINGKSYRTPHTAADAYASSMVSRLAHANNRSTTTQTNNYNNWNGAGMVRFSKAYKRVYPIFAKLLKVAK